MHIAGNESIICHDPSNPQLRINKFFPDGNVQYLKKVIETWEKKKEKGGQRKKKSNYPNNS